MVLIGRKTLQVAFDHLSQRIFVAREYRIALLQQAPRRLRSRLQCLLSRRYLSPMHSQQHRLQCGEKVVKTAVACWNWQRKHADMIFVIYKPLIALIA